MLLTLLLISIASRAQMNNPYVDDKLIHFGFSLGMNMMHFDVKESSAPIDNRTYHVQISSLIPGFSVGFITDLRLSRHLNLRFNPALHFGTRTLNYESTDGAVKETCELLSIPITIPLYLKWSAERENNYRPYVIAGGGFDYECYRDTERPVMLRQPDGFVEVGFGVDFYFAWFKFCPQLTYSIGFCNVLTPADQHPGMRPDIAFYTKSIDQLLSRRLSLTFNFE